MEEQKDKQKIKQQYSQLVRQLSYGCGNRECPNEYCASNKAFVKMSQKEIALKSFQGLKNPSLLPQCPPLGYPFPLSTAECEQLIQNSKYEELSERLGEIFSHVDSLNNSLYPEQ